MGHWLDIPLLCGVKLSGLAVYWASSIYQHTLDPRTENFDS
jgi:hypothetical protein